MPTQITGSRGTPVWIPHPELAWRPAVLLDDPSADKPVLVQWFDTKQTDVIDLDKICNGASPPLRNLSDSIQQADLASLPVLNEPEVLNNLKLRFCNQHEIYTYCGLLLIALNPYKDLPIYGKEFMEAYNQNSLDSEARRDPHIFAIADEALTRLKQLNQNQSIIISGESGAGKTVSANCVLQYFATIAGARCADMVTLKDTVAMHTKVLASSPLLEAFGNARTVRNDNSSRFGKFLEVGFSSRHRVVQAHMRTYLLEKSRVVFQGPQERNYHIFYQLLAASEDPSLRQNTAFLEELALAPGSVGLQNGEIEPPADFHYAHREHCKSVKGIDDLAGFSTTLESMRNLDFSDEEVRAAFVLVAATLHLGNVTFTDTARDGSQLSPSGTRALSAVLRLLERDFDANAVNSAGSCLCNRIIHTVEGQLVKPLSVSEATNARDALAKYFYQVLFEWVVVKCNAALETKLPPRASIRRKELSTPRNFIGVLDIYGFESFEVNSFEQFCINYANEKLQQRFITHVFKMEQEEYVREGLEWAFVDYYDNAPCIELLEGDMGIIALLNDECKMPKPQDKNWLARLCQEHLGRSRDFSQSKMWTRERFTIQHFSEQVEYTVEGFVEKNADRIIPEHAALLAATKNPIIKQMVERFTSTNAISVGRQGLLTKPTVVTQFSASLKALLETLDKTTVHYIRCIKPNDQKAPFTFSPQRTIQQLRACGVLQTIKISAAGYPSRWTYEDFVSRYWQLCPGKNTLKEDVFKVSEKILTQNIKNSDQYRLGRTKIFFGNGVLAHLERLRSSKIVASATIIQKNARGWLARQRYCRIRRHLVMVQAAARQWLAKARVRQLQEQKAKSNFTQASVGKDAKDHTWTFSLLRRHKSPHSETTLTRKRAKSKEALQTTIGDLQSQLTERENEIAAKDSQIAALLEVWQYLPYRFL
uniref:Myosin motor domain-containing protein n=2 Tax=Mesocestoides corti TaxID=53468 RepID=A0A5K3FI08_MESCO